MAFPKKGLRKITVNGVEYSWIAKGNDGWLDLYLMKGNKDRQRLHATFGYGHKLSNVRLASGEFREQYQQQFKITPAIVRAVILYGMKNGWDPDAKGGIVHLGAMDDKIID